MKGGCQTCGRVYCPRLAFVEAPRVGLSIFGASIAPNLKLVHELEALTEIAREMIGEFSKREREAEEDCAAFTVRDERAPCPATDDGRHGMVSTSARLYCKWCGEAWAYVRTLKKGTP